MSTIKVNNIVPPNAGEGVSIDGLQMPTAGALSNRNLFQNGAMQCNQRGTVSSGVSYGGPDRVNGFINATSYVCERSQQFDAPDNSGLQACYQIKTTTARTGTTADNYVGIGQHIEFQNVYNALWGGNTDITVSFWVKSSITGTYAFNLNPCNTNSGLSGDRILYHTTYTINVADTWEYKVITVPLSGLSSLSVLSTADTAQRGRGLEVTWMLGVTSGGDRSSASIGWNATEGRNAVSSFSNDTGFMSTVNAVFKVTGIQVEVGSKVTPFEHESYSQTLAKCQRYYLRVVAHTNNGRMATAGNGSVAGCFPTLFLPTTMRAQPSVDVSSFSHFTTEGIAGGGTRVCTGVGFNAASSNAVTLNVSASGGNSAATGGQLLANTTDAFLEIIAEL
jgi:hypothetical protein